MTSKTRRRLRARQRRPAQHRPPIDIGRYVARMVAMGWVSAEFVAVFDRINEGREA